MSKRWKLPTIIWKRKLIRLFFKSILKSKSKKKKEFYGLTFDNFQIFFFLLKLNQTKNPPFHSRHLKPSSIPILQNCAIKTPATRLAPYPRITLNQIACIMQYRTQKKVWTLQNARVIRQVGSCRARKKCNISKWNLTLDRVWKLSCTAIKTAARQQVAKKNRWWQLLATALLRDELFFWSKKDSKNAPYVSRRMKRYEHEMNADMRC